MKKQDFYFKLPQELVAQYPTQNRTDSRLLTYCRETGQHQHNQFKDVIQFLQPGDLLVMNDSRVIPARLYGQKSTGGKVELLIERLIDEHSFWAHIKASKGPKAGTLISLEKDWVIEVTGRNEDLFCCVVKGDLHSMLNEIGHIPLPPYIERSDESMDLERYQTVYARHKGSVAAPTAGLHFDDELLQKIKKKGIQVAYATLHVGAGTFRPLRCDDIKDHKMHREFFTVDLALCDAVKQTKASGNRVIAVGTTALRSLESATTDGEIRPCSRDTDIFIYPGYKFQICDGLITNFHLPESTLLMLISAFIGYDEAMKLYQVAIENEYRFFSYGDASFLY